MDDSFQGLQLLDGAVALTKDFVLCNSYVKQGDFAFLAGSLVEGIGNRFSDVDMYVITKQLRSAQEIDLSRHYRAIGPDRSLVSDNASTGPISVLHTLIPGSSVKLDIEFKTHDELNELASQVERLFDYACGHLVLLTKTMSWRERAFLHRIFHAVPVADADALQHARAKIDQRRFRYLLYRWKASDFSELLDLLGAWEGEEWERCVDLAREHAVNQFQALTHLMGNTHYDRKWLLRYANMTGVETRLLAAFRLLLLSGPGTDPCEMRRYVLSAIDFCDEVYRCCKPLLEHFCGIPAGAAAMQMLDDYYRSSAGAYSGMEIAYRKRPYGYAGAPTREWFTNGF